MNNDKPNTVTPKPGKTMESRLHALETAIEAQTKGLRLRQHLFLGGGVIVLTICCLSLASLTADAAKLDAPAVMTVARQKLEEQLPDRRQDLEQYLEEQAPEFVASAIEAVRGFIPDARAKVVEHLDSQITGVNAEVETLLIDEWKRQVVDIKSDLDRAFPNDSDAQKLQKLTATITVSFRKNVEETMDALYPDYAGELNRVHSYLLDLQNKPVGELTEKQRVHKEIIETMLRLALESESKK